MASFKPRRRPSPTPRKRPVPVWQIHDFPKDLRVRFVGTAKTLGYGKTADALAEAVTMFLDQAREVCP